MTRRTGSPSSTALASRTAFIGRADELASLADRFRRGDRLVTVLGPPGAGKTRLAERFAASWRGGEVVVCLLADAARLADVVRAMASALDVPLADETSADHLARLGFALAQRGRCLVLLDNVEQIAEHAAAALHVWIDAAPKARFLCTSRQRLALSGESCLPLGGMDLEHARALFLDRARLVGAPITAGSAGDDPAALDELLDRLDRLPLAIELAAARSPALAARQLLAALARRFELLRARDADVPARHATMRAAIDLSWDALAPRDQAILARASVFQVPFTLAAAAAVLGDEEGSALAAVERLRERSLLHAVPPSDAEGEVRFALYESIREYAAERLATMGATSEAEEAHARFFAAEGARCAAALSGPKPAIAVATLARDLPELLAAHRRTRARRTELAAEAALAAVSLLTLRGPFELERELLDDAIHLTATDATTPLRTRALFARGKSFVMRGLFTEALADFIRAREIARAGGDRASEARALYGMSASLRESGEDVAKARALAEEGLALARAAGDAEMIAWCTGSLAAAAAFAGDVEAAIPLHREAAALFERLGQLRLLALNNGNLALVEEQLGEIEAARATNAEAHRLALEAGDEVLAGKIRWAEARLAFDAGRAAEAEALLAELDASARRTGDREVAVQVLVERARRALIGGDREAGLGLLAKARGASVVLTAPKLQREIEGVRALADTARPALKADPEGFWFERAGVGRVELGRRKSLRLVFASLVAARRRGAAALAVDELVAAGWPGERLHAESGAMRVWTAIRTLRRLGLSGVLVNRDGGYALDPAVPIDFA